ncbi:MAG: hypothetical protein RIR62_2586 [Pseudomonadota bacterium]|jgi:outer membrane protein OmpU
MKKILLATTLLAGTAGFAAAEGVSVSGSARMGVIWNETDGADFSSRTRVSFSGAGETDGGLSFGFSVRADQSGQGNTANGDSTVFISGAFGKITMGDAGNAPDSLVGQVSGIGYGSGALDGAADVGFLGGNTATGVSYEYSAGAVTVALGTGQVGSDYGSVAVKYAGDTYSVALGYEDDGAENMLSVLGSVTLGSATVKAKAANASDLDDTSYALSVDYAMGAATLTAFYSDDNAEDANYGIGAAYDLGGGASLKGGVGSVAGENAADLGVTFSF